MATNKNTTLIAGIVAKSVSKHWGTAKLEWVLKTIWFAEPKEPESCLCGQFPILEVCVIQNRLNENRVQVGNCCVKRFLGLPSNIVFQGLKRIQQSPEKALNEAATEYAIERGWLTEWDIKFLNNTRRKHKLTPRQMEFRMSINQKVLTRLRNSRPTG